MPDRIPNPNQLPLFDPETLQPAEFWLPVPGYREHYEASNYGHVRHRLTPTMHPLRERPFIGSMDGIGYLRARIRREDGSTHNVGVHQLVALAFLGPCPEGYEVNHKDLDKTNNRPENLEYISHRDNLLHARANKTYHRDLTKPFGLGKLTAADVVAVRKLIREGLTLREIGRRFGVSGSAISVIKSGKSWRCLPDDGGEA